MAHLCLLKIWDTKNIKETVNKLEDSDCLFYPAQTKERGGSSGSLVDRIRPGWDLGAVFL